MLRFAASLFAKSNFRLLLRLHAICNFSPAVTV